jgi:hypothetical protein
MSATDPRCALCRLNHKQTTAAYIRVWYPDPNQDYVEHKSKWNSIYVCQEHSRNWDFTVTRRSMEFTLPLFAAGGWTLEIQFP